MLVRIRKVITSPLVASSILALFAITSMLSGCVRVNVHKCQTYHRGFVCHRPQKQD
jgi:ABC-type uncharacterized transport system auxiliary subunit